MKFDITPIRSRYVRLSASRVWLGVDRLAWRTLVLGILVQGTALNANPVADRSIVLTLAPTASSKGQIETFAITLNFGGLSKAAGETLIQLPLVESNVDSVATTLTRLVATDALGPLDLTAQTRTAPGTGDADSGGPTRIWTVNRQTSGPVVVRYIVPANATLPPRGPAPPVALSNDGYGASGAGSVFLLMPPGDDRYRTTIDWNLSRLPSGSSGISSLGNGHVDAEAMTAAELTSSFFMTGRLATWPRPTPRTGFFSAWQGKPAFDAEPLMVWAGTLYKGYSQLFRQVTPPPYGVFLRYNPINAGGGVAMHRSFVVTFGSGAGSDVAKLRMTLAHEMFHTFQPRITDPDGLASAWFTEGLATFYQRRLPLRYGMIKPSAFLDDLNYYAGRYYTNVMATVPNAAIPTRFWSDTRIRTLPYDRGMFYFATVDEAIRLRSGGKRSMDDAMFAMLALQAAGKSTRYADWETILTREIGPGAVADFRASLAGRMQLASSSAFGPCFRRISKPLRRYELGFDTAVLAEPKRTVRGLVSGSAAALAGLRNGDDIVDPVPQDRIQGDQTERLTLKVRRDGKTFAITYLPRGETVSAWQWERTAGVPDKRCAL